MPSHRFAVARSCALVAGVLLFAPHEASANFIWPPALYYFGATVWWAVPAGLAAEYGILYPVLSLSPQQLAKVIVIANLASAVVGFMITWPMVFWGKGIDTLADGGMLSISLIAVVILSVNVAVEYLVSIRWLAVANRRANLIAFLAANVVSFVVLVAAGFTALEI